MRGGITHPSGFEEEAYGRGFRCVGGVDEAGRGPWAGPVVAAAVVLPRGLSDPEIKDSKLLTPAKREDAAARIKEKAIAWGLGIVDVEEIDRINILKASLLAMAHACRQLRPMPDCLLIDGPHQIPLEFLEATGIRQQALGGEELLPTASCLILRQAQDDPEQNRRVMPGFPYQRAIVKGDRLSISIAAASILAKVARDHMMEDYDRLYPEYGFAKHKGYSSAEHLAALRRLGPAPIHRRSFRPVRECAEKLVNSK